MIAIAGFAFGREAAEHQIVGTIQGIVGQQSAQAIQGMIQNASSQPKTGVLSAVMGVVALILGAGGVVGQLQTSLNTILGCNTQIRARGVGVRSPAVHLVCNGFVYRLSAFSLASD